MFVAISVIDFIANVISTKVQPNQIWQGQDDAQSLVILVRFTVLPYLIGLYFSYFIQSEKNGRKKYNKSFETIFGK